MKGLRFPTPTNTTTATAKPGQIIYHVTGTSVQQAVVCGTRPNASNRREELIIYNLTERPLVVSDGKGHEWFACDTLDASDAYDTPDAAIEAALAEQRRMYRASLDKMTEHPVSENPQKATQQPREGQLNTLDYVLRDHDGLRARKAYCKAVSREGKMRLYMAYITGTDGYGFRMYDPQSKTPTRMKDWQLTDEVLVDISRAPIWSDHILDEWKAIFHIGEKQPDPKQEEVDLPF